ncbi:hypothetical protein GOBAR_AA09252 [Gossypium barbadense]|uniref:Leucine-rich repeat-containing N-terminal plant-type domain-containing protein n=1 Tax=Gossypium barbadense TaxID=3634 RepID=A0A2P5Y712_GOSBA|nr:hypothetical protein GOBAR_AA09252 [Gossypium barbadense]
MAEQLENKAIEAEKLREQNIRLQSRISELEIMLEKREKEIFILTKKLEDDNSESLSGMKNLTAQEINLLSEKETLQAEKALLKENFAFEGDEASNQVQRLIDKANTLQQQLESLHIQKAKLELQFERKKQKSSEKLNEMENQKSELKQMVEDLQRDLEAKGDEKNDLEFPKGICKLAFLDTLNLSTNYLSGSIPDNIGDMRWLESLDLSVNNFSGPIPSSLLSLTLLNHLKLSYNLSGRISTGYQLQTLNDSSNYEGNLLLCRVPLLTRCPEDINSPPTSSSLGGSKDKLWLYLSITMGYIVGFWGVCGTLVMKESWRQAYFQYVDELKEKLLLWIALAIARSRRVIEKGNN